MSKKKQSTQPKDAAEIVRKSVESLIPYARNARTHDDAQVAELAGSIREFGFTNPVLIDGDGGIIAGHGRVLAARKLKMPDVPCIILSHLTPEQKRAYILADNKLALNAGWDGAMLKEELDAIIGDGFTLGDIGFNQEEFDKLCQEQEPPPEPCGDAEPQIDKAAELAEKWGVKSGQLWQLGNHRLLCGDSTNKEDVEKVMQGEKADAVLTDPPYGQNQKGVNNDEPEIHTELMKSAIEVLPIENGIVVAFQSPRTFHAWTDAIRQAGFTFERMLWMYKAAQCTFPWRGWILKSESITVCSIGNAEWQDIHPFAHDCYYLSEVSGELDKKLGWHGSVKPMTVVSDLLSRICKPAGTVYEPFSGSGTTLIACEQLGRKCRAIEISPAYVAVAIQRWADATGGEPKRLS